MISAFWKLGRDPVSFVRRFIRCLHLIVSIAIGWVRSSALLKWGQSERNLYLFSDPHQMLSEVGVVPSAIQMGAMRCLVHGNAISCFVGAVFHGSVTVAGFVAVGGMVVGSLPYWVIDSWFNY